MKRVNTLLVADLPEEESFADAALAGLGRRQKAIPCKYLYDDRGSALFDAICELPEYYPTRTEEKILRRYAAEIGALAGPGSQLVEFGSGSSRKTRILLDAIPGLAAYMPIDISREHLAQACAAVARDYPGLNVTGICADYMQPLNLPPSEGLRLGFFPGSTIGNLLPEEARSFLRQAAALLGPQGGLLVGVDLKKDPAVLHAAYNDSAGITAAFNLNLLERMNRELGADFVLSRFAHDAFYNAAAGRIEIYIKSLARQRVGVAGRDIVFEPGERIHTEYSYKYTVAEFQALAQGAGFAPHLVWVDEQALFSVHYLRSEAAPARILPLRRG